MKKIKNFVALFVIAAASALAIPMSATLSAANFTVTNTADSGPGSLRQAILDANAVGTDDVIHFDAGVFSSPQVITLTTGELLAAGNGALTINGPGAQLLTISGNDASRVFNISGVETPSDANVTINGLTITGGRANPGGGIGVNIDSTSFTTVNQTNLTINNVVLTNNTTHSGGGGGGIYCRETALITVNNSLISSNQGNGGGAIHLRGNNSDCGLDINNSTLDGNHGGSGTGGIYAATSIVNINHSTISNNTTSGNQSAIRFISQPLGMSTPAYFIRNSTIAGNISTSNGATVSVQRADMVLENVTIANNSTQDSNSTGGLLLFELSSVQIANTLIANNTNPDGGSDLLMNLTNSEVVSAGYNLLENIGNSVITGNTTGNIIGVDPLLDTELRNNGGPTETLALLADSPAIDAGNSFGILTDQRGFTRPLDLPAYPNAPGSDTADIGAFEAQTAPTPPSTPNTPVGMNVTVDSPSDDASVMFAEVTAEGETTFTEIDPPTSAGTPPQGYTILGADPAYDISTTANYIPPITVCFVVSSINDPAEFERVRILHGEGGVLVDRTILSPDTPSPTFSTRTVCARVNSISPFVTALVPAATPSPTPTVEPSPTPTVEPSPTPTVEPSPTPTVVPSPTPTVVPSPSPTVSPTPTPTGSWEGDINRQDPNVPGTGDGNVDNVDLFWYNEFAQGRRCPSEGVGGEFQRLDGNDSGGIDAGDYNYIFNVWIGLLPKVGAKGPTQRPAGLCDGVPTSPTEAGKLMATMGGNALDAKGLRIGSTGGQQGDEVLVPIIVESGGNLVSTGFTVTYDPRVLSFSSVDGFGNPDVLKGPGASPDQVIGVNSTVGRIVVGIDFAGNAGTAAALPAGTRQVAFLRFTINSGTATGTTTPVNITPRTTVDRTGKAVTSVMAASGAVTVGGPRSVVIGGRVLSERGTGIRGASVVLTDSEGRRRTATTSSIGYFEIDGIEAGQTYVVTATARRFRFQPRTISVNDSLTEVNLVGIE